MAQWLKQSTAFTFRIGPFVDSTDGATAETALSIAQADIQISKAGGAFAQTSASPTTTHDADGWYQCPLTTTDTGTLGTLAVQIVMAGALPVWKEFMVVPANVWDSMFGADKLDVNAVEIGGATPETSAQLADAVWDEALSGHTTAGSAGKAVSDIEADATAILADTTVIGATGEGLTSLATQASVNTIDDLLDTEVAAIKSDTAAILLDTGTDGVVVAGASKTGYSLSNGSIGAATFAAGAIDAAAAAADLGPELADAFLNRNIAGGSSAGRTVKQALAPLRNKWVIAGGTLTVYDTDDTTILFTAAIGTAASDPIASSDPA